MEDAVRERRAMEQEAIDAARARVANLFRRPEQLDKVQEHRRIIQREKTALDSRIKAILEKNIDNFKDGVSLLNSSSQVLDNITGNFEELSEICDRQGGCISEYDVIKEVNLTRNNLIYTSEYLDNIFACDDLAKQLDAELDDPRVNLLTVHSRISQLEKVRDELLYYLRENQTQYEELNSYFSNVSALVDKLENIMWFLLSDVLEVCESSPKYIVSVMMIVYREEAIDLEITNTNAKIDTTRRPKEYKKKAFNEIVKCINKRFEDAVVTMTTDAQGQASCGFKQTVENMRFFFSDLKKVQSTVVQCFPPEFDIFNIFLDNYNVKAREIIDSFARPPLFGLLDTSDVWLLINYADQYENDMKTQMNIPKERIAPPMLVGKIGTLADRYMEQVEDKMRAWTTNILTVEWQEWFSGTRPPTEPEKNEDGQYVSSLPVILFQMIDQQLGIASKTNHPEFKVRVVEKCALALTHFQDEFEIMIKKQGLSCYNDEPNNEFFNEYMLLVVNNCSKCMKHTHHLATRLYDEVDRSHREACKQQMLRVLQGFIRLCTSAYRLLIEVVHKDSADCFTNFFSKEWYKGNNQDMETVILTAEDYFQDFREHMVPEFFLKFVSETHTRFLVEYIQILFSKSASIIPDKIGSRMDSDLEKFESLFKQAGALKVTEKQATILTLKELCECSEEFVTLNFQDLKKKHPEFTLGHMEDIVMKREDFSRSQRNEVMLALKNTKMQSSAATVDGPLRNFFSSIKIKK